MDTNLQCMLIFHASNEHKIHLCTKLERLSGLCTIVYSKWHQTALFHSFFVEPASVCVTYSLLFLIEHHQIGIRKGVSCSILIESFANHVAKCNHGLFEFKAYGPVNHFSWWALRLDQLGQCEEHKYFLKEVLHNGKGIFHGNDNCHKVRHLQFKSFLRWS